jgi:hypothetical protein
MDGLGMRKLGEGEGKQFFFEKKNQKTFDPLGTRWVQHVLQ